MKNKPIYLVNLLLLLIDLLIINSVIFFISNEEYINSSFLGYTNICWIVISYSSGFYNVRRNTSLVRVFSLLVKQFSVFFLSYFAYFSIFREGFVVGHQFVTFVIPFIGISLFKIIRYYYLRKDRVKGKGLKSFIIIGQDYTSEKVVELFSSQQFFGYKYLGFFSNKITTNKQYLGEIEESKTYILNNNIDEVYCSINSLTQEDIKSLTKFTTKNDVPLKLIPDNKGLYNKNLELSYYDTLPVLEVKNLPFDFIETHIIKRSFDIILSLLILIFILPWLSLILLFLIKIDSKGPLFFSQVRDGLNGNQFICYKFRSMSIGAKGKVTKIGKFLRKFSIDELPQFYNVLKGEMSAVGPRPHMSQESIDFQKEIEDYMKRKTIRPGITGLAQVKGYRGEILNKSDIENRVKYDIYYIENWSFFLDVKIIIQTIIKVIKGDEKAY